MFARTLYSLTLFGLVFSLSACGMFHRKDKSPVPPPPPAESAATATPAVPPVESAPGSNLEAPPAAVETETAMTVETLPASKASATATREHEAHTLPTAPGTPTAEQSLSWLKNGNTRFVKARLRKDGQSKRDVARLASGQHPHAIVLACSDSRVPPEIVFDQKLGEIFVVRTAGEALDENVIGSIEYALAHMHPHLILVMGHTQCGGVNAAIKTMNGGDAGSPALNHLVADIHPRLKAMSALGPASKDGGAEAFANARGIAADLVARSTMIKSAVETGEVSIRSALYNMDSGAVEF